MKAIHRSFAITNSWCSHFTLQMWLTIHGGVLLARLKVCYNEISKKHFQSNVAYKLILRMILCMIYSVSKCCCSYTNQWDINELISFWWFKNSIPRSQLTLCSTYNRRYRYNFKEICWFNRFLLQCLGLMHKLVTDTVCVLP